VSPSTETSSIQEQPTQKPNLKQFPPLQCSCGTPAAVYKSYYHQAQSSQKPLTPGKEYFAKCANNEEPCRFWRWVDGSRPQNPEEQKKHNSTGRRVSLGDNGEIEEIEDEESDDNEDDEDDEDIEEDLNSDDNEHHSDEEEHEAETQEHQYRRVGHSHEGSTMNEHDESDDEVIEIAESEHSTEYGSDLPISSGLHSRIEIASNTHSETHHDDDNDNDHNDDHFDEDDHQDQQNDVQESDEEDEENEDQEDNQAQGDIELDSTQSSEDEHVEESSRSIADRYESPKSGQVRSHFHHNAPDNDSYEEEESIGHPIDYRHQHDAMGMASNDDYYGVAGSHDMNIGYGGSPYNTEFQII